MKIAITLVQVPFSRGGAEVLAEALRDQLRLRGHEVDIVTIPFKWYPPEQILNCMMTARTVDLSEYNGARIDLMIAMKFPAYFIPHPNKVLWLMHQHRQAYDLCGTPLSDLWQTATGRAIAAEIKRWDDEFLPTFPRRFTISRNVTNRLKKFNGIDTAPLHVPLHQAERFRPGPFGDFVLFPGRFDLTKRQHLLVEALEQTPPGLRAVLIGPHDSSYGRDLLAKIDASAQLRDRVSVLGNISESQKLELYSTCAAVYNGVYDEDYGYVTIEAFYSGKPVITHTDSGGPLEFVDHGVNGWVLPPNSEDLALCLSKVADRSAPVEAMGQCARERILQANLSWDHVVTSLLG